MTHGERRYSRGFRWLEGWLPVSGEISPEIRTLAVETIDALAGIEPPEFIDGAHAHLALAGA